ncbi:MAG: DUF2147 domain-containing protein [Chitinophagaceae bacterium]|nr:MAG: DUF2147 domain-containing protein [Chitinophagaceae bacterium]
MIKAFTALLLALCLSAGVSAQDALLGRWWSPKKDGQIEFYKSNNGKYYGRLVWSKTPGKKDDNNPDASLRARELMGTNIFSGFTYDAGDGEWVDGKVYDPHNGKLYNCKLWITNNGKTLNARGYVGFSLLGRTEKFERVAP